MPLDLSQKQKQRNVNSLVETLDALNIVSGILEDPEEKEASSRIRVAIGLQEKDNPSQTLSSFALDTNRSTNLTLPDDILAEQLGNLIKKMVVRHLSKEFAVLRNVNKQEVRERIKKEKQKELVN